MTKVLSRFAILFLLGISLTACGSSDESNNAAESTDTTSQETQAQKEAMPETSEELVEQATFTDLEGNEVRVSDFEGKVVMIDLWETWCKPCLASFPTMQDLQEEYSDQFIVLAVTPGFTDTAEDARSFAQENDYDFRYLMDSNNLHEELGVQGIPYKIFVDANGEFIQRSMGSHGPQEDYKMIKGIIEEHKDTLDVEKES